MNPDHVDFAEWDAAYVLGALSPSDRRSFEAHLETCERCREAIAEIAPTLGLLARIDRTRAESLALEPVPEVDAGPGEALRDGLVSRARRERLRRQRTWWFGGLAAAAVLVAVIVVAVNVAIAPALRSTETFALEAVAGAPLTASVELADAAWGTRIGLVCSYEDVPGSDAPEEGWPYSLYVVDESGAASQVSTWRARPGSTARLDAATDLDTTDMSAIEIRSLDGAKVFMRVDLNSADG